MDILKKFKRGKKSNEGTETYQALYMYKATRAGDLSFDEGDQLEILTEETDGWWMASNPRTGTRGYVPSNFIRKLSSVMNNNSPASKFYTTATTITTNTTAATITTATTITTNTTPTTITTPTTSTSPTIKADKYIALYDYVAVDSESISLKKGEVMEVVFQPDNHWSYVKVLRGSSVVNEGYIPTSYITKLGENVNQPWYFGNMTRQEAHAYLMNTFNSNGSFLVRNSESTTGYSLSECMELEEFMREAEVMQKLRHPRLVKLYGLCTTPRDRPILIVVELVKNGALLQHLRKRKYEKQLHPVGDLVKIGLQVASGMAYLEAQKFIHRDLAARNVLIGEGISVKIADFGLARVIKDDVYHHNSNNKIPFKWTAPEAISFGQFTSKSDVWSYGILLFEIVTHGQMPYEGMDNQTAVKKIQQSYRLPQPASCPWELYNIMFRCWMENPEARPRFVDLKEEMSRLTTIF
nr:tyrosine-protein kinase FRK-like isoform X6 [Cherax quadricarinatus]